MMVMVVLGKGTTFPRFFMKWELVYMPVINICAWALDFPIMRRYTQEDIKGRPELKSRDFDYAHDAPLLLKVCRYELMLRVNAKNSGFF